MLRTPSSSDEDQGGRPEGAIAETEPTLEYGQHAEAQDVIDALRFALMAQKDSTEALKLVNVLLEQAPETESNRGVDLILHMITDASLKVSVIG